MRAVWIERGLWAVAGVAVCTSLIRLRPATTSDASIAQLAAIAPHIPRVPTDSLEDAVSDIVDQNLFRPERVAAQETDAAPPMSGAMQTVGMPSTKPRLLLRGVLGGPPWDAIIEGIPGHDGSVVIRAGQTIDGISIRGIHRDSVFARGFDTTWTLSLGRAR